MLKDRICERIGECRFGHWANDADWKISEIFRGWNDGIYQWIDAASEELDSTEWQPAYHHLRSDGSLIGEKSYRTKWHVAARWRLAARLYRIATRYHCVSQGGKVPIICYFYPDKSGFWTDFCGTRTGNWIEKNKRTK